LHFHILAEDADDKGHDKWFARGLPVNQLLFY
jgi:hypothetical protein